jgi:hypothetical protein
MGEGKDPSRRDERWKYQLLTKADIGLFPTAELTRYDPPS